MDATNKDVLDEAARLLVDIAGPAPRHIEMARSRQRKYYSVARALTWEDAQQHLRGVKTKGALCSYPGDQTRALAYDVDTAEQWHLLRLVARRLAAAGYRPLLEPSPRGRGGHLWLVFTAHVDGQAARHHAHATAPGLVQITEFWPPLTNATSWNRIRLPGGRYVAPGFSAWCKLYDASGKELSCNRMGAAHVLLDSQTPADLIPALPPDQPRDGDVELHVTHSGQARECDSKKAFTKEGEAPTTVPQAPKRSRPVIRNGGATPASHRFLWFRYSAAQLASWFNDRHSLDEVHPRERGGMAFSPSVSERTPSTSYHDTRDGERWTDFSAGARQSNGRPDGGDALELYVRLQGESRSRVLSTLGREMVAEARAALEDAARRGTEPPAWVAEITTAAGWQHYWQMARSRQHEGQP
jgi:hypothetical protein